MAVCFQQHFGKVSLAAILLCLIVFNPAGATRSHIHDDAEISIDQSGQVEDFVHTDISEAQFSEQEMSSEMVAALESAEYEDVSKEETSSVRAALSSKVKTGGWVQVIVENWSRNPIQVQQWLGGNRALILGRLPAFMGLLPSMGFWAWPGMSIQIVGGGAMSTFMIGPPNIMGIAQKLVMVDRIVPVNIRPVELVIRRQGLAHHMSVFQIVGNQIRHLMDLISGNRAILSVAPGQMFLVTEFVGNRQAGRGMAQITVGSAPIQQVTIQDVIPVRIVIVQTIVLEVPPARGLPQGVVAKEPVIKEEKVEEIVAEEMVENQIAKETGEKRTEEVDDSLISSHSSVAVPETTDHSSEVIVPKTTPAVTPVTEEEKKPTATVPGSKPPARQNSGDSVSGSDVPTRQNSKDSVSGGTAGAIQRTAAALPGQTGFTSDKRENALELRKNMAAGIAKHLRDKWDAMDQQHDVAMKLGNGFMKEAIKAANGKREHDPVIGKENDGRVLFRVATKSKTIKAEGLKTGYAYTLADKWTPETDGKVEEELSWFEESEVGILWITGPKPWEPENLKSTLQVVHMFEEFGGWVTVSTENRWEKRIDESYWKGKSLQEVMQMPDHYGITAATIANATKPIENGKAASFGSFNLQAMPGYVPAGYARESGGDSVTFVPANSVVAK